MTRDRSESVSLGRFTRVSLIAFVAGLTASSCGGGGAKVERGELTIEANATTDSTMALASGVQLLVPSGASTVSMTIVMATEPGARRTGAALTAVATPLVLTPEGATFDAVLELTVPIAPSDLPAGKTIDDVIVVTAPHGSTTYTPLPTRRAPTGNAVIAETTHFSDFVAVVMNGTSADGSVGGLDAGSMTLPPPNGMLHVFLTQATYTGDLGSISGADTKCMSDARRPTSGNFKAFVGGTLRSNCVMANCVGGASPVDWVFAPGTSYFVGAFGSEALFAITDTNAIVTTFPLGAGLPAGNFWSGMNADWTVASTMNCTDFASAAAAGLAITGVGNALDNSFFGGGLLGCNAPASLICIEQ